MDSFTIACDNMFSTDDNTAHFIEAMFSEKFDLASDLPEMLIRIHPAKKTLFEHLHRENLKERPGSERNVIEFNVNKSSGGIESIPYSRLRGVNPKKVIREVDVDGFDNNANPVIRELDNGSLRIVFCNLPPISYTGDSEFDMNDFGSKLLKSSEARIIWEDRDVFYVSHPIPETIDDIQKFIQNYSGTKNIATATTTINSKSKAPFCERAIAYVKSTLAPTDTSNSLGTVDCNFSQLVDHLVTLYVVDEPQGLVFIQDYHLEAENMSHEALSEIGLQNLRSLFQKELKVKKMGDIFGIFVNHNFEASGLLLDELWDQMLCSLIDNSFVVAVPSRDVLAFCDSQSIEGIKTLQEVVRRTYAEPANPNHLLSQDLYQRIDGKWVKFNPAQIQDQQAEDDHLQQKLRKNADKLRQLVKEKMNVELNYDAKSIGWINSYIDKLSAKDELKNKDSLIQLLAAFSGECFVQNYGGKWSTQQVGVVLRIGDRTIDPFRLVRLQMERQLSDNLSVFNLYEAETVHDPLEKQKRTHAAAEIPGLDAGAVKRYVVTPPPWIAKDPLKKLFDNVENLLQHGRIVWATLIQANRVLFELDPKTGLTGAAAELLYDPTGNTSVEDMLPVSKSILQLHSENVSDPDLNYIKDHLNAEVTRLFGHSVPASLSSKGLKMSSTWIERSYFPHGVIVLPYFPVLISDDFPGLVLPVPSSFWHQDLKDQWLETLPQTTSSQKPQRYVPPAEIAHLHPFSLVEEGTIYLLGNDLPRDYEKAKLAFEKAISQGSTSAYEWLAKIYDDGLGVLKDAEHAAKLREKGMELNQQKKDAETISAKTNNPEESKTQTPEERLKVEIEKNALDPLLQLYLTGVAHYEGIGEVKSVAKARTIWQKGAKLGDRRSMYSLGCIYFFGELDKADRRTGMGYFDEAAKRGCEDSKLLITQRRKTLLGLYEWGFRKKNLID